MHNSCSRPSGKRSNQKRAARGEWSIQNTPNGKARGNTRFSPLTGARSTRSGLFNPRTCQVYNSPPGEGKQTRCARQSCNKLSPSGAPPLYPALPLMLEPEIARHHARVAGDVGGGAVQNELAELHHIG